MVEVVSADVRVNVQEKPNCRIEMHVTTGAALVREAKQNAIKAVGKEVVIPGFRKGKAPEETILKRYAGQVEQKLGKAAADLAFIAAQKSAKVAILNNNSQITFEMKKIDENGAEMLFSFETEPKVPVVNANGFVEKEIVRAEVGDKQVEEAIRQMRFFYAQWKPVEDRAVKNGDYIMIDLSTVDEAGVEQKVFHHIRFEVSKERMANWMRNLVEGAKAGDHLEGFSEADDNATDAERAEFKPKKVKLALIKVEEAVLPEADDEFAKKVGAVDVAQMHQSIRDLLNRQVEEKVLTDRREQVNEFLAKEYHFELPKSLIQTETRHRLTQMTQEPKFKANWDKMSEDERTKLVQKIEEESAQAVRLFYLARQIVQENKIPVSHQEVQMEAVNVYQAHSGKNAEIDQMPKEVYALALSKIMLAKAQDFILDAKKSA